MISRIVTALSWFGACGIVYHLFSPLIGADLAYVAMSGVILIWVCLFTLELFECPKK